MTTIAYHHESGIVAFDGRITEGSLICSDSTNKLRMVGEDAWVFAGCTCDQDRFINQHQSAEPEKTKFSIDVSAIIVTKNGVFRAGITDDGEPFKVLTNVNTALGSGASFALAAMDFGRGADDAVRYAATRDIGTGGTVRTFDVKTMTIHEIPKAALNHDL